MFRIILFASMASVAAAQTACTDTLPTGTELVDAACVMMHNDQGSTSCQIQCIAGLSGSSQSATVDDIEVNCEGNVINEVDTAFDDWECTATTVFVCNTTAFDDFTNHDTSACVATVRN